MAQFTDIGFNNRLFTVIGKGERRFAFPKVIPEEEKKPLRCELGKILKLVGNGLELSIEPDAERVFHNWYMGLERSVHVKRLDGYALRLMELLAVNEMKTVIDIDTTSKAINLCNWQLRVRKLHDPIDADNKIARIEQNIHRQLDNRGELTEATLRKFTNARKEGLWYFETALKNLLKAKIIKGNKRNNKPYYRANCAFDQ